MKSNVLNIRSEDLTEVKALLKTRTNNEIINVDYFGVHLVNVQSKEGIKLMTHIKKVLNRIDTLLLEKYISIIKDEHKEKLIPIEKLALNKVYITDAFMFELPDIYFYYYGDDGKLLRHHYDEL